MKLCESKGFLFSLVQAGAGEVVGGRLGLVAGLVGRGGGGGGTSASAPPSFQAALKRLHLVPEVDQLSLAEPNTPGKNN